VIFHHDPDHDDEFLDGVMAQAKAQHPGVLVAAEGLNLVV
jgi:phosphoribosyl 1,2-cyclic phosphodiesterase